MHQGEHELDDDDQPPEDLGLHEGREDHQDAYEGADREEVEEVETGEEEFLSVKALGDHEDLGGGCLQFADIEDAFDNSEREEEHEEKEEEH